MRRFNVRVIRIGVGISGYETASRVDILLDIQIANHLVLSRRVCLSNSKPLRLVRVEEREV